MIARGVDSLDNIRSRVEAGEFLTLEEGLLLYESPDIFTLGELANSVRERLHGRRAFYNVNLHINYSNYCILRCKFCSFYRPYSKHSSTAGFLAPRLKGLGADADNGDGYELAIEEIVGRARAAYARGATEVHIVGGLHPKLPFSYYTDMCRAIREACPHLHIKAFTAIEIIHFTRIAKPRLTIAEVLSGTRVLKTPP